MLVNVSEKLLTAYKKEGKSIEYSIKQFLDSTPSDFYYAPFSILETFSLEGEVSIYEIDDMIVAAILDRCHGSKLSRDKLVNLFVWMAFLFPEI